MMRGLASADGVMVVPPHGVQLGETVPAFALPWGPAIPEPKNPESKPKAPARKAGKQVRRQAGSAGRPRGLECAAGLSRGDVGVQPPRLAMMEA